ncbi:AAA family ATPase [Aliarcobacter butzleri]|uniref:AAA family ATPase n=1 Tax=Aliarcobacter butzleri TaxID=28197 RepID=UPI003B226AE8
MELVYLWVEEYKNIRNQGFNFSPRFEFHYDKDSKKLTKVRDESTTYKSIFPENINITAIVGENGSGKSSLLELIYILLSENNIEVNLNFILIIQKESQLYYVSDRIINNEEIFKLEKLEKNDYYILRNEKFIFSERDDSHQINMDNNSINQQIALTYSIDISFKLTSFMYIPMKIEIKPILSKVLIDILNEEISINYIPQKIYDELLKTNREDIDEFDEDFENKIFTVLDADNIMDDFHKFLVILFESVIHNKEILQNKEELLKEYLNLKYSFSETDFYKYFTNRTINLKELTSKEQEIYFKDYNKFFIFDFIDSENRKYSNLSCGEKKLFGLLINIYSKSFDLENKGVANIFSQRPNDYLVHYLLDEPDTLLHPQWQKQFIKELLYLLKRINGIYNIVITSHSPFILSDIPKENVIFLEKYKENDEEVKKDIQKLGNCKNVSKDIKLKTFGANIHTLLSDGFFMSDGLMGEFAKSKINEIKKFYEIVKFLEAKNKKYKRILKILYLFKIKKFKHIQSIIGEPFLQTIIKNYLDDLHIIFSDDKTLIDKELAELEKRKKYLESLKNAKN